MLFPGRPYQPNEIFECKAGAYSSEASTYQEFHSRESSWPNPQAKG